MINSLPEYPKMILVSHIDYFNRLRELLSISPFRPLKIYRQLPA